MGGMAGAGGAGTTCTELPEWMLGTTALEVQHNGVKYTCTNPGLCSLATAGAQATYEPGVGFGYTDAWTEAGACEPEGMGGAAGAGGTTGGLDCSVLPAWGLGTLSTVVQHNGSQYTCINAGLCSLAEPIYEPGVGVGSTDAWVNNGVCAVGVGGAAGAGGVPIGGAAGTGAVPPGGMAGTVAIGGGGAGAVAGAGAFAGAAGSTPVPNVVTSSDNGCGCRVAGQSTRHPASSFAGALIGLALLGGFGRRRRRQRA
jgi:MYXO-CTERM domain-containing protein